MATITIKQELIDFLEKEGECDEGLRQMGDYSRE